MEPSAAVRSVEAFHDYLCTVLRRDRRLAKSELSHHRVLAQRLGPILWNGAHAARARRGEYDRRVWQETADLQADLAVALGRDARRLLKSLGRVDSFAHEGEALWPTDCQSMMHQVRRSLEQLVQKADEWASNAHASKAHNERKRPGPQRSRTRDKLSAWVADTLAAAGVWPTTAKKGTFTTVLAVVQTIAGFPERSPEQLERDARLALKYPTVVDRLHQLRKTATGSPERKIRIS